MHIGETRIRFLRVRGPILTGWKRRGRSCRFEEQVSGHSLAVKDKVEGGKRGKAGRQC
jgi:hypothetical protein